MKRIFNFLLLTLVASCLLTACKKDDKTTVTPQVPQAPVSLAITSFTPSSAPHDSIITIKGAGFSYVAANNLVTLNGIVATVLTASATEIKVKVPKNRNSTGDLKVKVSDKQAVASGPFTYQLSYTVSLFAGSQAGTAGKVDGQDSAAMFNGPFQLARDTAGNIYVADDKIRKITPQGMVSTIAASFSSAIIGIAVDRSNNLFVTVQNDNRIWKVPEGSTSPVVFAGKATADSADGQGSNAGFYMPFQLASDAAGNIYVADFRNRRLRKITPQGMVSTVGTAFSSLVVVGAMVDAYNNLYITTNGSNSEIWRILAGSTTPVVFSDCNAAGIGSDFNYPLALAADAASNIYVTGNHNLYQISPQGIVSTIATNLDPRGVVVDLAGNIYVAAARANQILKIALE